MKLDLENSWINFNLDHQEKDFFQMFKKLHNYYMTFDIYVKINYTNFMMKKLGSLLAHFRSYSTVTCIEDIPTFIKQQNTTQCCTEIKTVFKVLKHKNQLRQTQRNKVFQYR